MKEKARVNEQNKPKEWHFIYKGMFIIFAIIILLPIALAVPISDIILYYSLDDADIGTDTIQDLTGNGKTANYYNATTGVQGILAEAFNFTTDNNGTINISSDADLRMDGGGTFNLWANITDYNNDARFFAKDNGAASQPGGYALRFDGGDQKLEFYVNGVIAAASVFGVNASGFQMITVLMVNQSDGHSSIYVNGTNVTGTSNSVSINTTSNLPLYFGNRIQRDSPVNGTLDEIAMWSSLLSDAEITELYNDGNALKIFGNFTVGNIRDSFFNKEIQIWGINVNGTKSYATTSGGNIITDIPSNSSQLYNITFVGFEGITQRYINRTFLNYNVSKNIIRMNLSYNESRHNITAWLAPENTSQILNFTINSSRGESHTTTNGSVIIPTPWNTTTQINIIVDYGNFSRPTINVPGTADTPYSFSVFPAQTFNIRIFDEIKNQLITSHRTDLQLISDDFGQNHSTTNGTIETPFVTPGDYILRYNTNYTFERNYYINISELASLSIDLYLLNNSYPNLADADGVGITVRDSVNTHLENAIINVNKYFEDSNSYITVERLSTNFEGKTLSYLTNDEFYRFIIEVDNTVELSTSPTRILENVLTFIVDLLEDPTGDFKNFKSISTDLSYNNATSNFTLTYTDTKSITSEICLNVFQNKLLSDDLLGTSCSSSQSGTLIVGTTPETGATYTAKASATIKSVSNILDQLTIHFSSGQAFDYGNNGLLIVLVMTLVFVFVGIFNPVIMLLLAPLPLLLGSIIGFIAIPIGVSIAVYAAFIVVLIVVGRRT